MRMISPLMVLSGLVKIVSVCAVIVALICWVVGSVEHGSRSGPAQAAQSAYLAAKSDVDNGIARCGGSVMSALDTCNISSNVAANFHESAQDMLQSQRDALPGLQQRAEAALAADAGARSLAAEGRDAAVGAVVTVALLMAAADPLLRRAARRTQAGKGVAAVADPE
ncbi:hypothetical protein [Streptacidiphilus sp. EB129]|uniref:hypothetical protein n=1 Tax=Streptacidiphilus sp. EB129 TaxID=3156262 RepID=UPI0035158541